MEPPVYFDPKELRWDIDLIIGERLHVEMKICSIKKLDENSYQIEVKREFFPSQECNNQKPVTFKEITVRVIDIKQKRPIPNVRVSTKEWSNYRLIYASTEGITNQKGEARLKIAFYDDPKLVGDLKLDEFDIEFLPEKAKGSLWKCSLKKLKDDLYEIIVAESPYFERGDWLCKEQ
jgi:hypothetical protein